MVGFVVGAIFGDQAFSVVEVAVGNYWDELVFGIAGAFLAIIVYEIATIGRPRR